MKTGNKVVKKSIVVTLAFALSLLVVVNLATVSFSQAANEKVYLPLVVAGGSNEQVEEEAAVLTSSIWEQTTIEVCWDTAGFATQKSWTRNAVARTWVQESRLNFINWGDCTTNNQGIRITIDDVGPHTKGLGKNLNGREEGMVLNFTFDNWSPTCAASNMQQFCIEAIAVHEFGHAIGLAHEQNRDDAPDWCRELAQGTDADWYVTAYDMDSIMNYCNPEWSNNGLLSELDKEAVRILYGSPGPSKIARVWLHLSNGSVFEYRSNLQSLAGFSESQKWLSGDFDGDGRRDLVNIYGNAENKARVWLHLSKGASFAYQISLQTMADFSEKQKWLAGDFNGDGRDDLVNIYGNGEGNARVWLHLSKGDGFEYQSNLQTMAGFSESQKWLAGDFNGDGRADLVNIYGNGEGNARVWLHLSKGNGFEYQSNLQTMAGFSESQKWLAGDFNGDGRADLVNIYGNSEGKARVWLHLANGTKFEYQSNLQTLAGFWEGQKWLASDFNGDGRADLVNIYGSSDDKARVWLHLSNGTEFEYESNFQTLAGFSESQKWLAGDFNGDNQVDLVNLYGKTRAMQ